MNKTVLKRLEKVEAKFGMTPQGLEEKKRADDVAVLLETLEYLRKQEEMTMKPEELYKARMEKPKQVVEWYSRYMGLPPEEQERERERWNKEFEVSIAKNRAWLNSEERRQFDQEYQRWLDSRQHSSNEAGNLEAVCGV